MGQDKYDDEIEVIATALYPEVEVETRWTEAMGLFQFIRPSQSSPDRNELGQYCGCPTMIRDKTATAWTPKLTDEIRANEGIHVGFGKLKSAVRSANGNADSIRVMLQPYAELQRNVDKEIRNAPAGT